jgi:hypothetical protein
MLLVEWRKRKNSREDVLMYSTRITSFTFIHLDVKCNSTRHKDTTLYLNFHSNERHKGNFEKSYGRWSGSKVSNKGTKRILSAMSDSNLPVI